MLDLFRRFRSIIHLETHFFDKLNPHRRNRIRCAIEKIVALEGITVSEEEMTAAIAEVAQQNELTAEEMKPYINEEFLDAVKRSVELKKAMKLVRESAVLTEIK